MTINTAEDFMTGHDISGEEFYSFKIDLFNATGITFRKELIPISTICGILLDKSEYSQGFGYSHSGNVITKTDVNYLSKKKFERKNNSYHIKLEEQQENRIARAITVYENNTLLFSFYINPVKRIVKCFIHEMSVEWKDNLTSFNSIKDKIIKLESFLKTLNFTT